MKPNGWSLRHAFLSSAKRPVAIPDISFKEFALEVDFRLFECAYRSMLKIYQGKY
jgi:hypothetical protein